VKKLHVPIVQVLGYMGGRIMGSSRDNNTYFLAIEHRLEYLCGIEFCFLVCTYSLFPTYLTSLCLHDEFFKLVPSGFISR
jgi:hypothetical protein